MRQLENNKEMLEMGNLILKVGKGNRKYEVQLSSNLRSLIYKSLNEMSKLGKMPKNFTEFILYIKNSKKLLLLSYDEKLFLKKFAIISLKEQENMKLPWYKFITKLLLWSANVQFKQLVSIL